MAHSDPGYNSSHHLVELREPGDALEDLRYFLSLPDNRDIAECAMKGGNFEDCIGRIAEKLDIVLDGEYDPVNLMRILTIALGNRTKPGSANQPWLRVPGLLQSAELVESLEAVTLETGLELGTIAAPITPKLELPLSQSAQSEDSGCSCNPQDTADTDLPSS